MGLIPELFGERIELENGDHLDIIVDENADAEDEKPKEEKAKPIPSPLKGKKSLRSPLRKK